MGVLLLAGGAGVAQDKTAVVPDAQVEANVLKALAGVPQLADQAISTTTVYGQVTLTGTVRDEASRDMAEKVASDTPGVKKVIDQLAIGAVPPVDNSQAGNQGQPADQGPGADGTNPTLQSDGTYAPAQPPQQGEEQQGETGAQQAGQPVVNPEYGPAGPPPQEGQNPEDGPAGPPPQEGPNQANGQHPPSNQNPPNGQYPNNQYPTNGQYPQGGQYPPNGAYPPPYPSDNRAYGQAAPPYRRPYRMQRGGEAVTVPSGAMVRVRVNQAMDSKHTAPGTVFDGVVINDVVAGNAVAIPRGAAVQGKVVEVHNAGSFKGKGVLTLQLTQVTLGGQVYPVVSDVWSHEGADKTGQTVGNAVGLGAFGALVGAVAGGGPGALIGAGVGGAAGVGASAASHRGEAVVPSEAILTFHLTQPVPVTTVSQAEMNRLASTVQPMPRLQRRYPPPPPPYYGPGYYPYYR